MIPGTSDRIFVGTVARAEAAMDMFGKCYPRDGAVRLPIGLLGSAQGVCIYYLKTSPTSRETEGGGRDGKTKGK